MGELCGIAQGIGCENCTACGTVPAELGLRRRAEREPGTCTSSSCSSRAASPRLQTSPTGLGFRREYTVRGAARVSSRPRKRVCGIQGEGGGQGRGREGSRGGVQGRGGRGPGEREGGGQGRGKGREGEQPGAGVGAKSRPGAEGGGGRNQGQSGV